MRQANRGTDIYIDCSKNGFGSSPVHSLLFLHFLIAFNIRGRMKAISLLVRNIESSNVPLY